MDKIEEALEWADGGMRGFHEPHVKVLAAECRRLRSELEEAWTKNGRSMDAWLKEKSRATALERELEEANEKIKAAMAEWHRKVDQLTAAERNLERSKNWVEIQALEEKLTAAVHRAEAAERRAGEAEDTIHGRRVTDDRTLEYIDTLRALNAAEARLQLAQGVVEAARDVHAGHVGAVYIGETELTNTLEAYDSAYSDAATGEGK